MKRETVGWILFLASSVLFIIAGLRTGDPWTVAGGVIFGGACLLFLAGR